MASTIFFNGRVIARPGSYSEVDASGLEAVGLGATGIVGVVGTAKGGKPYTAITESDVRGQLQVVTRPQQARNFFREGDLREAAEFIFAAGIQGAPGQAAAGAQEMVPIKVNPATQSTASFANASGQALVLTSEDYGFHTRQISVEIANGTTQGKLVTIDFEAQTETFDDVGGDTMFTLTYAASTPADGFTTITAELNATRLRTSFTRAQTGLDASVSNQVTAGQAIELVSSSASDTAVVVRLYGINGSNATQSETLTLNGTTVVTTAGTWNAFHGAEVVSGTLAGTLTLQNVSAASTIATIAPAGEAVGVEFTVDHAVSGAVSVVAGGASTNRVTLFGLSNTGAFQTETLTLNGTTPVAGTALWSRIDGLALGALAAATTLTVSGTSVDAVFSGTDTLQKLADLFNGKAGYTLSLVTTQTTFNPATLDHVTAGTDIKSAAVLSVTANLQAIVTAINDGSELVTATRGSVASGAPANTTAPVFLSGGHEGSATPGQEAIPTATTADWQAALDLLAKVRVNTVVPLTSTPAIHAMVKNHVDYAAGIGRSERDAYLGLENAGQTNLPTKTEAKTQIVALNNRNINVVAQAVERFDTSGTRKEFKPYFTAALLAGLQAGLTVGWPTTNKYVQALKLRQDSSWNPTDDGEELIQAGLTMLETIDGQGRRVVRGVTSYRVDNNRAFTETSTNRSTNTAVFDFRSFMETMVGRAGFAGTANAAKGLADGRLALLLRNNILTAYRSLAVALILDVLEIDVEISPVLPVNFVKTTLHLVATPQPNV